MNSVDLIIVGVGGQGTVSIGHILGKAALQLDIPFVSSETHGMSQRGGSVIFHIRIGSEDAPLIPKGQADAIISGEPMEALRFIEYLKPNGIILSSEHGILSPVAAQIGVTYPDVEEIWKALRNWPAKVYRIDSTKLAKQLGSSQVENIVLLGGFIALGILPINFEVIKEILIKRWPKFKEFNIKALNTGYDNINQYNNNLATQDLSN